MWERKGFAWAFERGLGSEEESAAGEDRQEKRARSDPATSLAVSGRQRQGKAMRGGVE